VTEWAWTFQLKPRHVVIDHRLVLHVCGLTAFPDQQVFFTLGSHARLARRRAMTGQDLLPSPRSTAT